MKLKMGFFKCAMVRDMHHPYIPSTTVLGDIEIFQMYGIKRGVLHTFASEKKRRWSRKRGRGDECDQLRNIDDSTEAREQSFIAEDCSSSEEVCVPFVHVDVSNSYVHRCMNANDCTQAAHNVYICRH